MCVLVVEAGAGFGIALSFISFAISRVSSCVNALRLFKYIKYAFFVGESTKKAVFISMLHLKFWLLACMMTLATSLLSAHSIKSIQ